MDNIVFTITITPVIFWALYAAISVLVFGIFLGYLPEKPPDWWTYLFAVLWPVTTLIAIGNEIGKFFERRY